MDDRLEKLIRENRDSFDDKSPRKNVWAAIEKEMGFSQEKPATRHLNLVWKAAAVLFLFTSLWLVYDKYSGNHKTDTIAVAESDVPQLTEAEKFYTAMIDEKKAEIIKLSQGHQQLRKEFLYSLHDLDSMYSVLKTQLPEGNANEIADAMIMNLQLRINILNKQLEILKEIKNKHEDEHITL